MPIISSYPYDITIQDNDAWIGTDSTNRQTKQYTAKAVANYLNTNGKVSVGGQMVYKFSTIPLNEFGTFALPSGGGSGTGFSAISTLKISITEKSGQNVVPWLEYLVSDQILISSQEEVSSFGHYTVLSYSVDPNNSSFYTLDLGYIGGNGSITANQYYDIVNFALSSDSSDKTFVYNQGTPSAVWTIQHNLGKFPSVTAVNSSNIQGFGEVQYIDSNNLTITFSAGFSGKAYLN
jgi:hypothetical protein